MIKINLASKSQAIADATRMTSMNTEEGEQLIDQQDLQKQGLFRLVVMFVGPLSLMAYQNYNIPQKRNTLRAAQSQLSQLEQKNNSAKTAVEETKKFRELESKLQSQIQTIDNLRQERFNEVKLLDWVQQQMPEKLWLTRIEMKDQRMDFQGIAETDAELTAFMDILGRSPLIASVNLIKSTEQQSGPLIIKKFEIQCALKVKELAVAANAGGAK